MANGKLVDSRKAMGTAGYVGQNSISFAAALCVAQFFPAIYDAATTEQTAALSALTVALVNLAGKAWRDWRHDRRTLSLPTIAPVLFLLLVPALWTTGCQSTTQRQDFYMARVSLAAGQSAALAYLSTPYGENAPDSVLTAIQEANGEANAILDRLEPLVPPEGQDATDVEAKALKAGLETVQSVTERLNRVLNPALYEEKTDGK